MVISNRRMALSAWRRSKAVLSVAFTASACLLMLGLDGLLAGHRHLEADGAQHHRHLFNGHHTHHEVSKKATAEPQHTADRGHSHPHSHGHRDQPAHSHGSRSAHHHAADGDRPAGELPATPDDQLPGQQGASTATLSTLLLTGSLEATAILLDRGDDERSMAAPPQKAPPRQLELLTDAQVPRPPPASRAV